MVQTGSITGPYVSLILALQGNDILFAATVYWFLMSILNLVINLIGAAMVNSAVSIYLT